MLVKRLRPLPVEAVVRGYLAGSGWKEYQAMRRRVRHCTACRPAQRKQARLQPIFTPATKARKGRSRREHHIRAHERHHRRARWQSVCATSRSEPVRHAAAFALTKGIIIADTKFEFGLDDEAR